MSGIVVFEMTQQTNDLANVFSSNARRISERFSVGSFDVYNYSKANKADLEKFPKNVVEILYINHERKDGGCYGFDATNHVDECICKLDAGAFVYVHYYYINIFALDVEECKLVAFDNLEALIQYEKLSESIKSLLKNYV